MIFRGISRCISRTSYTSYNTFGKDAIATFGKRSTTSVALTSIPDANRRHAGRLEIRADADGRGHGVYTATSFCAGELILSHSSLVTKTERDVHSVQVGKNLHATIDAPGRFMNHRCNTPTAGVRPNQKGAYDFIALRDIEEGEEMTIDYETFEDEIMHFYSDCQCGDANCKKQLKGFKVHGEKVMEAFGREFVAPHLLELYDEGIEEKILGDAVICK